MVATVRCVSIKLKIKLMHTRGERGGGYLGKFYPPQRGSVPPLSDGFTPPTKQRAARISSPIGQNDLIPRMELSFFGQKSLKKRSFCARFTFSRLMSESWSASVSMLPDASRSAWLLRPHARVRSHHARTHLPPLCLLPPSLRLLPTHFTALPVKNRPF